MLWREKMNESLIEDGFETERECRILMNIRFGGVKASDEDVEFLFERIGQLVEKNKQLGRQLIDLLSDSHILKQRNQILEEEINLIKSKKEILFPAYNDEEKPTMSKALNDKELSGGILEIGDRVIWLDDNKMEGIRYLIEQDIAQDFATWYDFENSNDVTALLDSFSQYSSYKECIEEFSTFLNKSKIPKRMYHILMSKLEACEHVFDKHTFNNLSKRVLQLKCWKWMDGMLFVSSNHIGQQLRVGDKSIPTNAFDCIDSIIFNDPATEGCVRALVRSVFNDPNIWTVERNGIWHVCWSGATHGGDYGKGSSEVEALINALENYDQESRF